MYLHITLIFVFLSCFTLKLFVIRLLCFLKTGAFRNRSKSDSSRTQLSLQSILSKVGRDGWLPESRFKIKVMFKYGNDCNNQSHLMTKCYCSSRSTRDVQGRHWILITNPFWGIRYFWQIFLFKLMKVQIPLYLAPLPPNKIVKKKNSIA